MERAVLRFAVLWFLATSLATGIDWIRMEYSLGTACFALVCLGAFFQILKGMFDGRH